MQEELETPLRSQPDWAVDFHYNTEYRNAKEVAKEKRGAKVTQQVT